MNRPACRVLVAMFLTFRISWSSKIFGLPTFYRTTSPPRPPLNLILQLIIDELIRLCLGYFNQNLLMGEVPNIGTCFPISFFTFSGICFWYWLGRLCDFLFRLPQNSIQHFIILRSVFVLFKIINFSLFILQFDSDTKMVNDTRTSVLVNLVVCHKINREWPLLLFDQSRGWSIWTIKNWDIFREKFPNIFISSWKRKTVKLTGLFTQWITDHLLCWGLEIPLILNFKSPPYIT